MSTSQHVHNDNQRELVLERIIDAPPEKLFRAWTEPELLKIWFTPRPWTVASASLDVRAGGSNVIVMSSPEGQDFPNRGVYLEVVENERIVFTDAFTEAWVPSDKAFMTATITFEPIDGKTKYTARVLHWNSEDRQNHEDMGFYQGWSKATDQLEELVASI